MPKSSCLQNRGHSGCLPMLGYILRTIRYQAEGTISRAGQARRVCLPYLNYLKSGFLDNWKPAKLAYSRTLMITGKPYLKFRELSKPHKPRHKNPVILSLKGKLVSCSSKQGQTCFYFSAWICLLRVRKQHLNDFPEKAKSLNLFTLFREGILWLQQRATTLRCSPKLGKNAVGLEETQTSIHPQHKTQRSQGEILNNLQAEDGH